ncbi:MAG: Tfp pilus assembly protein FimT [bacterium]|jgi:Tfp pilus assembly protein FimT
MKKAKGTSLLEVSIIMLIMVLLFSIAIPNFANLFESSLAQEAKKIAVQVKKHRLEAILKNLSLVLTIHPAKQQYEFSKQTDNGLVPYPNEKKRKVIRLPSSIRFSKVQFDKSENNPFLPKSIQVRLYPTGYMDQFLITLQSQKHQISLQVVHPLLGKIKLSKEEPNL